MRIPAPVPLLEIHPPRLPGSRSRAGSRLALGLSLLVAGSMPGPAAAADRPNLTSTRIGTPFGANGHTSSLDGRLFMGNIYEDASSMTTRWHVRAFRPEALRYDAEGRPDFSSAFSAGKVLEVHNGENALAFCFADAAAPYQMESSQAVYRPWIFDSQMFGPGPNAYQFRRRSFVAKVSSPFTASAEVSQVSAGGLELLVTTAGTPIMGIEPTMTSDGRLFIFQGSPKNDGSIDHIMYSYNDAPCAATGWSVPRTLGEMNTDPNPALKRYPLSWQPLRAATGETFTSSAPLHGAYPWVDHEGRNVVYMGVVYTDGARREGASIVGAETGYMAYHVDGGINASRYGYAKLFFSGPMWGLEQERSPVQTLPAGASNEDHYLPVTKNHDVLALFGSNTGDYNEIDLGDLSDPFQMLYLPMNELVTRGGEYDLKKTPDLSGHFFTGTLTGSAQVTADNDLTTVSSLWQPRGKGRALQLDGGGAVRVRLSGDAAGVGSAVRGFSLQLALRPDAALNNECGSSASRYLLLKKGSLELTYEADHTVQLSMRIGQRWVRLGKSPTLPRGQWSHIAYAWDGVSGQFGEYLNGVPTGRSLPTATGSFRLWTGNLYVGAGDTPSGASCPNNGGGSFIGALDEVRFFSHARSARSICLTTPGADCLEDALQEDPTGGQFVLSLQDPGCASSDQLGSMACAKAMHRACAQRGAMDALASTSNLWDTLSQLIGNRPPISLAGVPTGWSGNVATVACSPIEHESVAVTFEELARYQEGCTDDRAAATTGCAAASHRFCSALGWTTGTLFELTSRPWVGCFDADRIEEVGKDAFGASCASGDWSAASCRVAVSGWCAQQGYGAGVVQEVRDGTYAQVHCFHPASVVQWPLKP